MCKLWVFKYSQFIIKSNKKFFFFIFFKIKDKTNSKNSFLCKKNYIVMKKITLILFVLFLNQVNGQSTVNSGSLITSNAMVSIGEIVVNPINTSQSSSGIIGILAQINQQTLEVSQFDVAENVTVYPNPTVAKLFFESQKNLSNEKIVIYNESGQLIAEKKIDTANSIDLNELSSGIYLIQFSNKQLKSFKIIKK